MFTISKDDQRNTKFGIGSMKLFFFRALLAISIIGYLHCSDIAAEEGHKLNEYRAYPASALSFSYTLKDPNLPPLEDLDDVFVDLIRTPKGYTASKAEEPTESIRLGDLREQTEPVMYTDSAIIAISRAIVAQFNELGYVGVFVIPDPSVIDSKGRDLRSGTDSTLPFIITHFTVSKITTDSKGKRFEDSSLKINRIEHQRTANYSPIKVVDSFEDGTSNLLNRQKVVDYAYYLTRHPTREVDVFLKAGSENNTAELTYTLLEKKPWNLIYRASNQGSRNGERIIHEFSFKHFQVSDSDDILFLDYATTNFENYHYLHGSYDRPVFNLEQVRCNIDLLWTKFNSSVFALPGIEFEGRQERIKVGLKGNILQRGSWFLDIVLNLSRSHIVVDKTVFGNFRSYFLIPAVGLTLERSDLGSYFSSSLFVETNLPSIGDTNKVAIKSFGRADPDARWYLFKGSAVFSYFFDHWFKSDEELKEASGRKHHEIRSIFVGQGTFQRLIPHMEQAIGGLRSVRGHYSSAASGPSAIAMQNEYRFNTRPFGPNVPLVPFCFIDAGRVMFRDHRALENSVTLVGTGIGLEGRIADYVKGSIIVGVPLISQSTASVKSGTALVHFNVSGTY